MHPRRTQFKGAGARKSSDITQVSVNRHENAQPVVAGKAEQKRPANLFLKFQLETERPASIRAYPPVPVEIEGAEPAGATFLYGLNRIVRIQNPHISKTGSVWKFQGKLASDLFFRAVYHPRFSFLGPRNLT